MKNPNSEFRLPGSERLLTMIKSFSATEKVIFGVFSVILIVTALSLVSKMNALFMVPMPARGGSQTEAIIGLPRLVNPVIAVSDVDRDLSTLIYSGLLKYSHGNLVPDLAKKYIISADGLTYSFTLRDDIRFHDGTQVTAEDIEFTIERIQDPNIQSPLRVDWKDITMKRTGLDQIEFSLKQPYAPFLNNLTIGILPKHIWKNVDANQFIFSEYNIRPVGSGPYELSNIARDGGGIPTEYNLVPFSKYVHGAPYISNLNVHFYSDEKSAVDAVKNGNADSLAAVSSSEASRIASSTNDVNIVSVPLPRIFAVFLNQNNALLTTKEVRTALSMSIDKKRLVDEVLEGYGVPIDGPIPFGTLSKATTTSATALVKEKTSSTTPNVKEQARLVLEKAGWVMDTDGIYVKPVKAVTKTVTTSKTPPKTGVAVSAPIDLTNGTRLSFSIATADAPDLKQTAEFIKKEWKEVGIEVNIKIFEAGDLIQSIIRDRKYDAVLFGEVIGKDLDLFAFWHSSQRNSPGLNLSMYANSKADKLLEDARKTSDEDVRIEKYAEFEKIVKADTPAIFLYSPDFIYLIRDKVKGVNLEEVTAPWDRWNNVNTWYIKTDNVWKFFASKIVVNK